METIPSTAHREFSRSLASCQHLQSVSIETPDERIGPRVSVSPAGAAGRRVKVASSVLEVATDVQETEWRETSCRPRSSPSTKRQRFMRQQGRRDGAGRRTSGSIGFPGNQNRSPPETRLSHIQQRAVLHPARRRAGSARGFTAWTVSRPSPLTSRSGNKNVTFAPKKPFFVELGGEFVRTLKRSRLMRTRSQTFKSHHNDVGSRRDEATFTKQIQIFMIVLVEF